MLEVRKYQAEEIKEFNFLIANQNISITKAINIKLYAGNTAYINKKKVQLTENDLEIIENARQIYFLYSAGEGAYQDDKTFSISKLGHGEYTPTDFEAFKKILSDNKINIIK